MHIYIRSIDCYMRIEMVNTLERQRGLSQKLWSVKVYATIQPQEYAKTSWRGTTEDTPQFILVTVIVRRKEIKATYSLDIFHQAN